MIERMNSLTIGHFLYVVGAGVAAGFLFVLVDNFLMMPLQMAVGVTPAQPVI